MPVTVPDTAEHNALANKVALLESTQKLHSQTLANHATEIARLYDRVAALEQQPVPEPVPTPIPQPTTDFTLSLIGGWRLTEPYSEGGLAIDFASSRLWTTAYMGAEIVEFNLPSMGSGANIADWPVVNRTKNLGKIYHPGVNKSEGQASLYVCGLAWHQGMLWTSGRFFYPETKSHTVVKAFTLGANSSTLVGTRRYDGTTLPARPMPRFGGGFITGDGNLLVGNGGSESGPNDPPPAGPCWMRLDGWVVNEFGNFHDPKEQRERREGNYSFSGSPSWCIPPDTHGYWFAGRIFGGGLTIRGQTCFWVQHGTGRTAYDYQNETLTEGNQNYLYRYLPGQHFGSWERFGAAGAPQVRGCQLSPDGTKVYLHRWKAYGADRWPLVEVYEVRDK